MTQVILVRHCETELSAAKCYSGQMEALLTPRGRRQQEQLATRLAGEAIGRIASSDLTRCRTLAEAIAVPRALPVAYDEALREARFGRWEGLTYEEALAGDPEAMAAFNNDPARTAPPDGESLATAGDRALALLMMLVQQHRNREDALLIIGHGGTLRAVLCLLLHIPLERYWTLRLDPASLTRLDCYPYGSILEELNSTDHLCDVRP